VGSAAVGHNASMQPFPLADKALLATQLDNMLACIRCGACLPVCPTYLLSGVEEEGPRGRIAMALALHEGYLQQVTPDFVEHEESCLLCDACSAVCPSGVRMDLLGTTLRAAMARPRGRLERSLRAVGFALLADLRLLRAARLLLRWSAPLRAIARGLGILGVLGLADAEALLPPLSAEPLVARGQRWRAANVGKGRVSLFSGCIMSVVFSDVDRATGRVLAAHRWEVTATAGQGCCGSLHAHEGERERARALARRNIEAFETDPEATVVVNAAGCGAMLKGYGQLLADDPAYAERALAFARRVQDVSEFLAWQEPLEAVASLDVTVSLQEPCHLAHAQRLREAPRALLRRLPGVTMREMAESSVCCGSAGIYNMTHPVASRSLGERKRRNAEATGAQMMVTANPGCQLQLGAMLKGSGMTVRHLVELLDEAYRAGGAYEGLESGA